MSSKYMSLALGLALFAAAPLSAEAADWNNGAGGLKDYRSGGVPVPAPVPVMEHFRWYLRADAGVGMYGSGGDFTERGLEFGGRGRPPSDFGALTPLTTQSSWFSSDFDTFATGSVGAGIYLSPRFRSDVTVDIRTPNTIRGDGNYTYDVYQFNPPPTAPAGITTVGQHTERIEVRDTSALINFYYDLVDRGQFTPYIGVGLGMAARTMKRTTETYEEYYNNTVSPAVLMNTSRVSSGGKDTVWVPAASLTAGAAYTLQSGLVLDFNYRYMYIAEAESSAMINGMQSFYKVGETHEHALRAGVRWNVW